MLKYNWLAAYLSTSEFIHQKVLNVYIFFILNSYKLFFLLNHDYIIVYGQFNSYFNWQRYATIILASKKMSEFHSHQYVKNQS